MSNRHVCILGAPGSGKTVVAKALSSKLSADLGMEAYYLDEFATMFVTQYRDEIETRMGGCLNIQTQYIIAQEQLRLENKLSQSLKHHVIVSDTSLILNYVYACRAYNPASRFDKLCLESIHDMAVTSAHQYDAVVLLPIRESGDHDAHGCKRLSHHMTYAERSNIHAAIQGILNVWGIKFHTPMAAGFESLISNISDIITIKLATNA